MAVFTPLSTEALGLITDAFQLGNVVSLIGVAEGDNESTFLLMTADQEWLVTLFESPIDPFDLERAFQRMEILRSAGVPCPRTLRLADGASSLVVEGKLVAIVGALSGTQVRFLDQDKAYSLGRTIAHIHTVLLANVPVRWKERAGLVRGWLHGALTADNVFFLQSHVSGVINFRLQHEGFLIEDLGQALASWGVANGRIDPAATRGLISGYNDLRALEERELESIPFFFAAALMTSLCLSNDDNLPTLNDIADMHKVVADVCAEFSVGTGTVSRENTPA